MEYINCNTAVRCSRTINSTPFDPICFFSSNVVGYFDTENAIFLLLNDGSCRSNEISPAATAQRSVRREGEPNDIDVVPFQQTDSTLTGTLYSFEAILFPCP